MAEQTQVTPIQQEKIDYGAIARSVLRVGQSAKRMHSAGLAQRAIHLLIHDQCKVGIPDIQRVLYAAAKLPEMYLTPEFIRKNTQPAPGK